MATSVGPPESNTKITKLDIMNEGGPNVVTCKTHDKKGRNLTKQIPYAKKTKKTTNIIFWNYGFPTFPTSPLSPLSPKKIIQHLQLLYKTSSEPWITYGNFGPPARLWEPGNISDFKGLLIQTWEPDPIGNKWRQFFQFDDSTSLPTLGKHSPYHFSLGNTLW